MVSSAHLMLVSKIIDSHGSIRDIEALDERKYNANRWLSYQKGVSRAYNKKLRSQNFIIGDLVLKATWHVQKGLSVSKFTPKWMDHMSSTRLMTRAVS